MIGRKQPPGNMIPGDYSFNGIELSHLHRQKLTISKFVSKPRTSTAQITSNTNKMNSATNANTPYNSSTFQLLDIPTKFNNVDSLIRVPRQEKPATTTSTTSNNTLSGITFQLLHVPTKLKNVDSLTRASHDQKEEIMPGGYLPSDSDICCGRGTQHKNMTGNINFRNVIRASVDRYMAAPSKADKTAVVVSIVEEIRHQGGHFLKQQELQHDSSSGWYDIGDAAARDKVGHSLRDQAASSASSAATSPLQLAKKEHARRSADTADDFDSIDFDAAMMARLAESLSSLSCTEEMIVDCFPITTLSRGPPLVPIDIITLDSDAAVVARLGESLSSLSYTEEVIVDSVDSDAAVVARLAESLSSLLFTEEIFDDCFPATTSSRRASLVPIEISSVVWDCRSATDEFEPALAG
jgi:hypothetical protein